MFAELLGTTWNISLDASPLFSSNEGGNNWTIWTIGEIRQLVKLEDLWNIPDISMNPRHPNSETKKVCTLQPKPSQAMLKEQLSLRSGLRSSTGKVQQCSLTQWLHNHTSCTCAALQHSARGWDDTKVISYCLLGLFLSSGIMKPGTTRCHGTRGCKRCPSTSLYELLSL